MPFCTVLVYYSGDQHSTLPQLASRAPWFGYNTEFLSSRFLSHDGANEHLAPFCTVILVLISSSLYLVSRLPFLYPHYISHLITLMMRMTISSKHTNLFGWFNIVPSQPDWTVLSCDLLPVGSTSSASTGAPCFLFFRFPSFSMLFNHHLFPIDNYLKINTLLNISLSHYLLLSISRASRAPCTGSLMSWTLQLLWVTSSLPNAAWFRLLPLTLACSVLNGPLSASLSRLFTHLREAWLPGQWHWPTPKLFLLSLPYLM